ncbi:hypothetical protein C5167_041134 [Papaver somniferum]|uniref:Uncharacterized protein n=1 Tax=Papaver somniferum TaxID=3469 RepID=A0A4Y7IK89_PAPSO|nr:hypothetical protein C5167_041134 [Papaver somniferum]
MPSIQHLILLLPNSAAVQGDILSGEGGDETKGFQRHLEEDPQKASGSLQKLNLSRIAQATRRIYEGDDRPNKERPMLHLGSSFDLEIGSHQT